MPTIVALARKTLPTATRDRVAAAMQRKSAAEAQADLQSLTRKVQAIVNQTPPAVPQPPKGPEIYSYDYHPGATKPDFNNANLLPTRELWKGDFVHMNSAPDVYYHSADCEFNPQTKYFFTSRNVPKKRLTNAEYQELTRLYRLMGRDEQRLAAGPPPPADVDRTLKDVAELSAQLAALPAK